MTTSINVGRIREGFAASYPSLARKLIASVALFLIVGNQATAEPTETPLRQTSPLTYEEAVLNGKEIGIGSARIVSPDPAIPLTVAEFGEFVFEYKTGKTPIETGGRIRLLMRHVFHWSNPQSTDPAGAGYTTVKAPSGAGLELVLWPMRPDSADLFLETHPWQHAIELRVVSGTLKPGDRVRLTYGDRSGGGPGARIQPTDEDPYPFRVMVAPGAGDQSLPLANDLGIELIAGPADRLVLVAPSTPETGEPMRLTLRAEDRYGNLATSFAAPASVSDASGRIVWSGAFTLQDGGLLHVNLPPALAAGRQRYTLRANAFTAVSNPVTVLAAGSGDRVWWGDLHGHTLNSDGRGTTEQFYTYCRDVSALDFCAVTDHDFLMNAASWVKSKAMTEAFLENNRFVTLQAYEWSGMFEVGGDHNIFFRSSDPPLFRSRSYYDPRNQQSFHSDENKVGHVLELNEKLLGLGERQVLSIPHWGGREANPEWHEPRLERLIEYASDHARQIGWAYRFLNRGYRLGIIASSDSHTGHPANGFLSNPFESTTGRVEVGNALVAVRTPELTRDGIFDALYDRRAYATTGDRILLDMHAGATPMGSEVTSPALPPIRFDVTGTAPITRIEMLRNGEVLHEFKPGTETAHIVWADPSLIGVQETAAYWIHVFQANGEEAVSSPIWWTRSAERQD